MTFETHTDTVLAQAEDMPDSFEPAWMPGWSTDSYIRGCCPHIKKLLWGRSGSRYSYLYRMIEKGQVVARKADGFWFYSKESLDQLEEILEVRDCLRNDEISEWYDKRQTLNNNVGEIRSKKAQVRQNVVDAMNKAAETMEQAKALMHEAFQLQMKQGESLRALQQEEDKAYKKIEESEEELKKCEDNEENVRKWVNRKYTNYQVSAWGVPDYEIKEGVIQINH